ncbi:MAG: D-alanine--D-alanine ligase family protein [Bryobacterales bacterium]|nr:D-alanine--D-alanine ligase family protein [Bryobacterales bacterium]
MKLRVAVIYGGRSGEHEVSIRSARSIMDAMDPARYEVVEFFISKEGEWSPRPILPEPGANPGIDVVFPILHGTFGEDGTVQGLLELAGLPYVGAGVLASSVAMDKEITKRLCLERGLPVVEYLVQFRGGLDPDAVERAFSYPVFVKPANLGSSVGISKAHHRGELEAALNLAAEYDRKVIVERSIEGQEIECSVLGNDRPIAATPCEILPSREFYDYDDKYILDQTGFRTPADLTPGELDEVRRLAVACYRAVDCEGMARVDFLVEGATRKIYINEINTIPGFTSISMYPKMWEHDGLCYPDLVARLIELALERHAARMATRFTR